MRKGVASSAGGRGEGEKVAEKEKWRRSKSWQQRTKWGKDRRVAKRSGRRK